MGVEHYIVDMCNGRRFGLGKGEWWLALEGPGSDLPMDLPALRRALARGWQATYRVIAKTCG